jgi:hypothetical protein
LETAFVFADGVEETLLRNGFAALKFIERGFKDTSLRYSLYKDWVTVIAKQRRKNVASRPTGQRIVNWTEVGREAHRKPGLSTRSTSLPIPHIKLHMYTIFGPEEEKMRRGIANEPAAWPNDGSLETKPIKR